MRRMLFVGMAILMMLAAGCAGTKTAGLESSSPTAEAEKAARQQKELEALALKAALLGTVCQTDVNEVFLVRENVESKEYTDAKCASEKTATDKGKEICEGSRHLLAMIEVRCLYDRAMNINPGEAKPVNPGGGEDDPCVKEFWATQYGTWSDNLKHSTCQKDFLLGVLKKAEAAGVKSVVASESERLRKENEELEQQLKVFQEVK